MAVYKESDTNTLRCVYRYIDWIGECKQTSKRGFTTKREALAWEREQLNFAGHSSITSKHNSAIADFMVANAELLRYNYHNIFCEVRAMAVSYKKLWKLLIDRDMKKKDLCQAAGISHASIAKLGKNENVTTDVLVKICTALNCDISDIVEIDNQQE